MYARNTSGIFLEAMCLGKNAWCPVEPGYSEIQADLCDEVGPV